MFKVCGLTAQYRGIEYLVDMKRVSAIVILKLWKISGFDLPFGDFGVGPKTSPMELVNGAR